MPGFADGVEMSLIAAWAKRGVVISQDSALNWHWTEMDIQGNRDYSPPFHNFRSVIEDIEGCYGSLEESK